MHLHMKLLALLIITLTCGLATSSATAGRLSIDDEDFEIIWPETEDLNFGIFAIGTVECSVTISGVLHNKVITKFFMRLIGTVSQAAIGDCDNGTARIDTRPPWHVSYVSFWGTLPAIAGVEVSLSGQRFSIVESSSGAACLTNSGEPAQGRANVGASSLITGFTALNFPPIGIDDVGGSFLCDIAGTITVTGTGIVTDDDGRLVTIRLI